MEKDFQLMLDKCEELGWSYSVLDDGWAELSNYTPAGGDKSFTVNLGKSSDADGFEKCEFFIKAIYDQYSSFDVSYETYIWLDSTGHGTKGAPYDMCDLYNDMEAYKGMIEELHNELKRFYNAEICQ